MANVVIFDEATQKIIRYLKSVNTPDYQSRTDVVINPDISGLPNEVKYWKHDNGSIVEMTQGEKDTLDAELAATRLANVRARTKAFINTSDGKIVKALALVIMDEINILRALHGLPNRTANQLLNAVNQKVDNGDTD